MFRLLQMPALPCQNWCASTCSMDMPARHTPLMASSTYPALTPAHHKLSLTQPETAATKLHRPRSRDGSVLIQSILEAHTYTNSHPISPPFSLVCNHPSFAHSWTHLLDHMPRLA